MSIAAKYWPLIPAAFGLISWFGGLGPASASEAASVLPSPSARLGEIGACRVVAPNFERNSGEHARPFAVRFPGGAKLRFLVAEPCDHASQPFDV
jgi:hypothetical protein